jgi:hypothetical protein
MCEIQHHKVRNEKEGCFGKAMVIKITNMNWINCSNEEEGDVRMQKEKNVIC